MRDGIESKEQEHDSLVSLHLNDEPTRPLGWHRNLVSKVTIGTISCISSLPGPRWPVAGPLKGDNVMGFFGFLLLGLIAGAIAKLILPGRQGGGIFGTLVVGVIGALLGGWLGGIIFNAHLQNFFSLETWLLAIGGSIVLLLIWGLVTRRRIR